MEKYERDIARVLSDWSELSDRFTKEDISKWDAIYRSGKCGGFISDAIKYTQDRMEKDGISNEIAEKFCWFMMRSCRFLKLAGLM